MSLVLRGSLLIFSIVLIIVTIIVIKKGLMPIRYSLLWFFSAIIILLVALFPILVESIANLIGFITISNLIIGILITLLLFLTMSLTIISAGQQNKITLLIQEVSLLKHELKKRK